VVLVTGLVAAVAGWLLVRATIGRAPAGSAEATSHQGGATDANEASPANHEAYDDDANREANADVEPGAPANAEADVEADATEPSDVVAHVEPSGAGTVQTPIPTPTSSTPPSAAGTTVRRGRVAYIRCGDTDRCPRDAALEDAAWAIVEALPSCARLAGQTGSADVRFHFEAETVEVRFRDHGDRPLSIPALRACLVGPSAALRTTLTPRPLTASFRFDLVAE
jgi:hypothetical protein